MKIKYVKGNLFDLLKTVDKTTFVPHICNDIGAWGAGFVVPLAKYCPEARAKYIDWHKKGYCNLFDGGVLDFELGAMQIVPVRDTYPEVIIANMIAQSGTVNETNPRPIKYIHLVDAMKYVAHAAFAEGDCQIICPKFGSGLAGGNWDFIEALIQEIWLSADIPVTVCYL